MTILSLIFGPFRSRAPESYDVEKAEKLAELRLLLTEIAATPQA